MRSRQMSRAIISVGRCNRVRQSAIIGPILGGQKGKKESWRCVYLPSDRSEPTNGSSWFDRIRLDRTDLKEADLTKILVDRI